MAKVVSFINMKGGVGKTTLSVNIGYTLAKEFGKRVLLIDADPQMNATQYTLHEDLVYQILDDPNKSIFGILDNRTPLPGVLHHDERESQKFNGIFQITNKFHVIPSNIRLMELNLALSPFKLRKYIKENVNSSYDIIIIDSPPTISSYTNIALLASQYYIVPMTTDYLSLVGLPILEAYISNLKQEFAIDLTAIGIILNKVDTQLKMYQDVKQKILAKTEWRQILFNNELLERTMIGRAFLQEKINANQQYIIELNNDELKQNIIRITQEFMQKGRI